MDERFPRYLLVALALYGLSFLTMLALFVLPVVQSGLAVYADFYFYLLLMVLPLFFLVPYLTASFGAKHGTAFRLGFVVSTLALSLVYLFIIAPIV